MASKAEQAVEAFLKNELEELKETIAIGESLLLLLEDMPEKKTLAAAIRFGVDAQKMEAEFYEEMLEINVDIHKEK